MKRLRVVLICLAAMGVALFALLWLGHAREPRYAGKPVSYWFGQYCRDNRAEQDQWWQGEAEIALKVIGTNAVPYLMTEVCNTRPDTAASRTFYKLFEGFPRSWHLPRLDDALNRRVLAVDALTQIKPPANLVLPQISLALVRYELGVAHQVA